MSDPTIMKAFVHFSGEPNVGIPSITFVVEVPAMIVKDSYEGRAEIRDALKEAYRAMCEETPGVAFEDECPDCGKVGEHKCFYDTKES